MPEDRERCEAGGFRAQDELAERNGEHSGGGGAVAFLGSETALRADRSADARGSARGLGEA